MKSLQKLRRRINEKFIFNNPTITREIQNYYERYGRSNNVLKRAILVCKLLLKYGILKYNPVDEKEKHIKKLQYPESCSEKNRKDLERILTCKNETIVFEAKNVLFYVAISEKQLLAIYETQHLNIGLSDYIRDISELSLKQKQEIEKILLDYVFDNEEIHEIYNRLVEKNKTILVYNNTKLSDSFIKNVMKKYGYAAELTDEKEEFFVTIHLTSERDILYRGRNAVGQAYRPYYFTNVYQAVYCQIVNLQLHNRQKPRSLFYEYGFANGGPLTCGFSQYLNQIAEQEHIDKFLFVARDGFIIKKIYDKYFKKVDTTYLIFSRFASYELIFNDFPEEYIDKNIRPRIYRKNYDNRIRNILKECDLDILRPYLIDYNLTAETQLNEENFLMLRDCILQHKDEISNHFSKSCAAAKKYFLNECNGYQKVCVVDLGWHGKSIVYLKHLIENQYRSQTKVVGAMIAAFNDDITQNYIANGLIHTYAFTDEYWRHTGVKNGTYMGEDEIICIESLFSAETDTLLRYTFDENGETDFIFGKKNRNKEKIKEIHSGISDFAEKMTPILNSYGLTISSRDAYTPLDCTMRNKKLMYKIRKEYYEEKNAINGF